MASRIRLAYSARCLYQRYKRISHSMQICGLIGLDDLVHQSSRMRKLGRIILGLALVEIAHSLQAQGRPGIISADERRRKSTATRETESDDAEPKPKPETKGNAEMKDPPPPMSWSESLSQRINKMTVHPEEEALLHQIDRLCEEENFETALDILNNTRGDTAEHLWRRGRLLYQLAKNMPNNNDRKQLIIQGHKSLVRAIEMDEDNYNAHFWMSPIVHARAEIDGLVATAHVATLMEKHLAALVRLRPEDPISHFSYGMWYYAIAEISWLEKLAASAIGAGLPKCTFEQALEQFMKSEEIAPNQSILNTWMIGKSYLGMKDYENAQIYLSKAVGMPAKKETEINAKEESIELLKRIESKLAKPA